MPAPEMMHKQPEIDELWLVDVLFPGEFYVASSVLGFLFVIVFVVGLVTGCSSSKDNWTPKDAHDITDAVKLGKACDALCTASDAGACTPKTVAGCFESIDCNLASALHRHGGSDFKLSDECHGE